MRKLLFFTCMSLLLFGKRHAIYEGVQTAHVKQQKTRLGRHNSGYLTGPIIGYTFRDDFYANIDMRKSWGTLHHAYRTQDVLIDGMIGYTFKPRPQKLWLTPKLGFGYEFMKQYRKDSSQLVVTIRKPNFLLGGIFEAQVTDFLKFGLDVTAMINLETTLEVGGFSGSRWILTRRNDFLIQVPWTFEVGHRWLWDVAVVPYYRIMRHGRSIATNSQGVPLNVFPALFRYIGVMGTLHHEF
ncbi:MAG: hypothetical protein SP1CHLAM54_02350 [Chlamydiia bacterium]|nr:hypothetical protein [Chlamydiia bacterium]MCH9615152.1 hypothetical protein [Chlamydiia bacterium]MCH9628526.1 hypothetical protein [Chlamydiia bacterium]